MATRNELFEIFDAKGNASGTAPRARVHREGLWHRAASVFLFRSDGRLLVQRRHSRKDVYPGAWDLSVAEHLKLGETYEDGAARGLLEELGVRGIALQPIGAVTAVRLDIVDKGIKDYEFQRAFHGVFDGEIQPNSDEVWEIDAVTPEYLTEAFVAKPQVFTPWFRDTAIRVGICTDVSAVRA